MERERLARELHDGPLQALTAVALQLAALRPLIASDPGAAQAHCDRLQDIVVGEQRVLRSWLAGRPGAPVAQIPPEQLVVALRSLCLRAESQWGVEIEMSHGMLREVSATLADHAYRIVQEGLANAGRHARAARVRVRIDTTALSLAITVEDDGTGFIWRGSRDLTALERRGNGPRSLMRRVASLGGQMSVTSQPSGTTLRIALPTSASHRDRSAS